MRGVGGYEGKIGSCSVCGRLLKKTEILEVFKVSERWYPKKMTFKDLLSRGKGTEYIINSIDFNVKIPSYKFTKAALRK